MTASSDPSSGSSGGFGADRPGSSSCMSFPFRRRGGEHHTVSRRVSTRRDVQRREGLATTGIVTSVAVAIRQMSNDEFERWLPQMREDYAQGMAEEGGVPAEAARAKAAEEMERLFPDGLPSPAQSVFAVEIEGKRVGELWVAERDEQLHRGALWIFHVRIDEHHRGRGYGRAAMLLAEGEARQRGLDRIALNVFGGNEAARSLYRSLGYEEQAVTMGKML